MDSQVRSPAVVTLAMLLSSFIPAAHADGICTPRTLTATEKKAYSDAYALFARVAPPAPDGWTSSDHPKAGPIPRFCRESGSGPVPRRFQREFSLERGRKERDDAAMRAYADQAKTQQATVAANQAAIDANNEKIKALMMKAQEAAVANRFAEVESLTQQADALMQENTALMGLRESDAQAQTIEAKATRDTSASFSLSFETPTGEPGTGAPYRTGAGEAFLTAYDDGKGNPVHDVSVYFAGAPEHARVRVSGDPARVRGLIDATDLAAIAAFR